MSSICDMFSSGCERMTVQLALLSLHTIIVATTLAVWLRRKGPTAQKQHILESSGHTILGIPSERETTSRTAVPGKSHSLTNAGSSDTNFFLNNAKLMEVHGDYNELKSSEPIPEWLSETDYTVDQGLVRRKRVGRTGEWILETPEYLRWRNDTTTKILWCPGIPGVGKTVLASVVIDDLQQFCRFQSDFFVGYIYLTYRNQETQNLAMIIGALCRQIFESGPPRDVSDLGDFYDQHKETARPTLEKEFWNQLTSMIAGYQTFYIIIDGLDEYTATYRDDTTPQLLRNLLGLGPPVKLFLTSRRLAGMEDCMTEHDTIKLEIRAQERDLRNLVAAKIASPGFVFQPTESLRHQLEEKVVEVANGRFLMIEVLMNLLLEALSPGDLKDDLKGLPNTPDEVYAQSMKRRVLRQDSRRRDLAVRMLRWVLEARRDLTVSELQYALAFKTRVQNVVEYIVPMSTLTSLCVGLIVIQKDNRSRKDIAVFVHESAQIYFNGKHGYKYFQSIPPEFLPIQICFDYLSAPCNWEELVASGVRPRDFKCPFHATPFHIYALSSWRHHIEDADSTDGGKFVSFLRQFGSVSRNHACTREWVAWPLKPLVRNGGLVDTWDDVIQGLLLYHGFLDEDERHATTLRARALSLEAKLPRHHARRTDLEAYLVKGLGA